MINLELTEEEADNLLIYLSMHSTDSAHDTFGVYSKLSDKVHAGGILDTRGIMRTLARSVEARRSTVVLDSGLIEMKVRV